MARSTLLIVSVLLVISGCSYYETRHSILETIPYVNQCSNMSPDLIDGSKGTALGISGGYIFTDADPDTSIELLCSNVSVRTRRSPNADMGLTISLVPRKGVIFQYFVFDAKSNLVEEPVLVAPAFGSGVGYGIAGFMLDTRISLITGVPLLKKCIIPYVAPRLMLLTYPYGRRTGIAVLADKWTTCWIPGYEVGLGLSLPLAQTKEKVRVLKVRPHLSYAFGREPKEDRVRFNVLQLGLNLIYAY